MLNLQSISLTIDDSVSSTSLVPDSGFDAIKDVTLNYLWDYWWGGDWGYSRPSGKNYDYFTLNLNPEIFEEAFPEAASSVDDLIEMFLDPRYFAPFLTTSNHTGARTGTLLLRTTETAIEDTNGDLAYLPSVVWRLTQVGQGTSQARYLLDFFTGHEFVVSEIGCVLKFTGIPTQEGMSREHGFQSYYAYFVSLLDEPDYFYLIGITPVIKNRINSTQDGYIQENLFPMQYSEALTWFNDTIHDCAAFVKYSDLTT